MLELYIIENWAKLGNPASIHVYNYIYIFIYIYIYI